MSIATQYPTSFGTHGTLGTLTNPANVYVNDGTYTTGAPGKNVILANAYGSFGFDAVIGTGATISAVLLVYEYKVSTSASNATTRVHSIVGGTVDADHNDTGEATADTQIIATVTTDRTWTPTNLYDNAFTVGLHAVQGNDATAVTFSFDYLRAEVTYSLFTAWDKTCTETITLADAIAKGTQKPLADSLTPSDGIAKQAGKFLVEK